MKFFNSLLLALFGLFQLISLISSKLRKSSKAKDNHRKIPSDPSLNPLKENWATGPRHAFGGGQNLDKYKHYSSKLAHYHNYHDTTAQLRKVVTGH